MNRFRWMLHCLRLSRHLRGWGSGLFAQAITSPCYARTRMAAERR